MPFSRKTIIVIASFGLAMNVLSCSDNAFKSGSAEGRKNSSNGSNNGLPTGLGSPDSSEAGIKNRNIKSLYFSGNGPGSCGGADNCVPGAPACIAPAVKLETAAMQGDCFACASFPNHCGEWKKSHFCNGNRAVCSDTSSTAQDVTTGLHLDFNSCPAGWVPSGPAGGNYHVLGLAQFSDAGTTFKTVNLCKQTKPAAQVKSGDYLVTDIRFMTPGQRLETLPAQGQRCPPNDPAAAFKWDEIGVIPDCGIGPVTPGPGKGACTGFLAVCQKTERMP